MTIQETAGPGAGDPRSAGAGTAPKVALLNDPKVRGLIIQAILVIVLAFAAYSIVTNTIANLERLNISSGFGFLDNQAGFGINQTLVEYSETSSYGGAFIVGLLNTLLLAGIGVVLATILGFVVGIARLSNNWLISRTAYVYIEFIRNIPLLLQIFIWYFGVLRLLPAKQEAWDLGLFGQLNVAGLYLPKAVYGSGFSFVVYAFIAGVIATIGIRIWARNRQMATGQQFPVLLTGLGLIIGLPLLVFLAMGLPLAFEYPTAGRFGPRGGTRVLPEFIGLLLALVSYTGAFIAEIVRAGILAVNKGQTEASYALGVSPGKTLRLVVIPQALRVIIPPLTSQYLNLTKNSSLAVAIAYPEVVSVGGIILNITGQAVEIILMWMGVYLTISVLTSIFMNWYNRRMALAER